MGLTMEMRKGFAREKAKRYRQGSKKKKGQPDRLDSEAGIRSCIPGRCHPPFIVAWTLR